MATDRARQKEARLLRSLAGALSVDPSMSYQRLAEAIGVSRRTLYRIAPSRDALFERLRQEAVAANNAALLSALSQEGAALDALASLTQDFVEDSNLYEFWTAGAGANGGDLEEYRHAMTLLFERGQREGVIRNDLPTMWLIQSYDGLLLAAAALRKSGAVTDVDLPQLIIQTLLRGVGTERVAVPGH